MRRKDREVTDLQEILRIMSQCDVCRLGLCEDGIPYVVPLNFGFEEDCGVVDIYFHGAKEGRKLDILRKNPSACVEFDCGHKLLTGPIACAHSFAFESVVGVGRGEILQSHEEKARGLAAIHRHTTGKAFDFTPEMTEAVSVVRVRLEDLTGKRRV